MTGEVEAPDELPSHYFEVRWACPRCGRFIAESAVRSWDVIDPGEYYGVRGVIVTDCGRCGEIEPVCRPVRERPWLEEPVPPPAVGDGSAWLGSAS